MTRLQRMGTKTKRYIDTQKKKIEKKVPKTGKAKTLPIKKKKPTKKKA